MKHLNKAVVISIITLMLLTSCSIKIDSPTTDTTNTSSTASLVTAIDNLNLNGQVLDLQSIITKKLDLKETKDNLIECNIDFTEIFDNEDEKCIAIEDTENYIAYVNFIYDKSEKLKKVIIFSDKIKTSKGIRSGDKISKVFQAYGKNYKKVEDSSGCWAIIYNNIQFSTSIDSMFIDAPLDDAYVSYMVYYIEAI